MNEKEFHVRVFDWFTENIWLAFILLLIFSGTIFSQFEKWSHVEIIELVSIPFVAGIAAMALSFWHRVRVAEAEVALKKNMLERGLTPDEIERLLTCQADPAEPPRPPRTDAEAVEELGLILNTSGVSAAVIEEVFLAVSTAEPNARPTIYSAIRGLAGADRDAADDKSILAALRGLRGPATPPAQTAPPKPGNPLESEA